MWDREIDYIGGELICRVIFAKGMLFIYYRTITVLHTLFIICFFFNLELYMYVYTKYYTVESCTGMYIMPTYLTSGAGDAAAELQLHRHKLQTGVPSLLLVYIGMYSGIYIII